MTEEESKEIRKLIEGHVGRLKEQGFDAVQIFCSKSDSKNGTRFWDVGSGNFLARFGHASIWVKNEDWPHCARTEVCMFGYKQ